MTNSHFSVSFPRELIRELLFPCILILLVPVAFTLFQGERSPVMYVCFLLLDLPLLFGLVWMRNFRIDVDGDRLCVRRGIGTRYSFAVSEIEKVVYKGSSTRMGNSQAIQVFARRHKIAVSNLMEGSDLLDVFLRERVPAEQIHGAERACPGQSGTDGKS